MSCSSRRAESSARATRPSAAASDGTATGSGFVVDKDGTILTNAHVVEGAKSVTVRFDENGDTIDAKVQGRDPSTDLAVLKIDPSKAGDAQARSRWATPTTCRVGDPTIAIGNPFGLARTVTTGIVSAKQRQIEAPNGFQISNVIQTDASINPGNSGGPLLDAAGRVIGINSQIATGSGGSGSVGHRLRGAGRHGEATPSPPAPGREDRARLPRRGDGRRSPTAWPRTSTCPSRTAPWSRPWCPGGPAVQAGLRGGRTPTSEGVRAGGDLIVGKVDGKEVKDPDARGGGDRGPQPGATSVQVEYYRGQGPQDAPRSSWASAPRS